MDKYRLASRVVRKEEAAATEEEDGDEATDFLRFQSSLTLATGAAAPRSSGVAPPGHVRVRRSGKMKNYVAYAAKVLRGARDSGSGTETPCRVVITGSGSALNLAVSVAEILKRTFAQEFLSQRRDAVDEGSAMPSKLPLSSSTPFSAHTAPPCSPLHQLNRISMQTTSLIYEPIEEGLDTVHVEKTEPHIEIRLAWTKAALIEGECLMREPHQKQHNATLFMNGYQPPGCSAGCEWLC